MTKVPGNKVASHLLDLPLLDSEGCYCGIVDDIEFSGGPGKPLKLHALLVGPGAWHARLPRWAAALATRIAGDQVARVPWSQVKKVGGAVQLKARAASLGLHRAEDKARGWIPRGGAL